LFFFEVRSRITEMEGWREGEKAGGRRKMRDISKAILY